MQNRGMFFTGLVLMGLGVLFFIGSVFHINLWAICCPVVLIAVGLGLVFRPSLSGIGGRSEMLLIGDYRRQGAWQVSNTEFWLGVGDIDLDMTQADLPEGETRLRVNCFVGDVKLRLPQDAAVAVEAGGFVVEVELGGKKIENIFTPVEIVSEGYAQAARRLRIEMTGFVVDLKVKQG